MKTLLYSLVSLTILILLTAGAKGGVPHFEDYPVSETFKGKSAPIDFSSDPDAIRFRTRLTEGVENGPNFSGHYTVILWGCGTECETIAVVDAKTGAVYFAPFVPAVGVEFHIDSNLFIANPPEDIESVHGSEVPDWLYSEYYKWENNHFVLIHPMQR